MYSRSQIYYNVVFYFCIFFLRKHKHSGEYEWNEQTCTSYSRKRCWIVRRAIPIFRVPSTGEFNPCKVGSIFFLSFSKFRKFDFNGTTTVDRININTGFSEGDRRKYFHRADRPTFGQVWNPKRILPVGKRFRSSGGSSSRTSFLRYT